MLKDVILLSAAARGARGVVVTVLYTVFVTTTSTSRDIASLIVGLVDSPLTKPTFQYGNRIC
jgi:hypothetical protein